VSAHEGGLAFFIRWRPFLDELVSLAASTQNEVCKGASACWASVLKQHPLPPTAAGAAPAAVVAVSAGAAGSEALELWLVAEQRILPLALNNLTGKPFPDVRVQTWRLLAALVGSQTCARIIVPSQEVRDILFDFTSEEASEARIAKHEFVVAMGSLPWLEAFLGEEATAIITEYMRQGPHWTPRVAAVGVGDQSST